MSPHRPSAENDVLRIVDANANRVSEGLRVVEEYVRFVLDDGHLTTLCKQLRHDLAAALGSLAASDLCAARDTAADVGTEITAEDEYGRADPFDVALASQKRVEQSLRCIEEYSKTLAPSVASAVEQLRYRAYTLGKAVATTSASLDQLSDARLCVLIDGRPSARAFGQLATALVDAGVPVLQLRDKQLADRELLGRARQLRQLTQHTPTLCIVNDRPDIAALSDADGVHVGQEELRVKDARRIIGTGKLIGVSTHTLEQARQAVLDGAHYIGCGPTFPSSTKHFEDFPGPDFLRQVAAEISLPAFAIGGIELTNVAEVISAGFSRIAVSGCVATSVDPGNTAHDLLTQLGTANVRV